MTYREALEAELETQQARLDYLMKLADPTVAEEDESIVLEDVVACLSREAEEIAEHVGDRQYLADQRWARGRW